MRYFRQGLLSILSILAVAFATFSVMRWLFTPAIADFASYVVAVAGMTAMGFLYRQWNGPLLFTRDGVSHVALFRFALGAGVILGPLKVAGALSEGGPLSVVLVIVLLLMSPVLAGLSVIGPMIVGSWFFDAWILRANKQ